jgi:uncharacterized membrane protein YphA (DoxX/SURF4 family)
LGGLEGGDGGVDEDVLVGGVGKVERGSVIRGGQIAPRAASARNLAATSVLGAVSRDWSCWFWARRRGPMLGWLRTATSGGDQRDDLAVGEQDGQVGAQQLLRRPPRLVVVLEAGVDGVQEGIDQAVQQGVLGAVVVVDGGLGHAQGTGQVGDGGADKPAHAAGTWWAKGLFMLGLLAIGIALIAGVAMRIAAISGVVMLAMMWLAEVPFAQFTSAGEPTGSPNPFADSHYIYAVVLIVLAATYAGTTWGLGRALGPTPLRPPQPLGAVTPAH